MKEYRTHWKNPATGENGSGNWNKEWWHCAAEVSWSKITGGELFTFRIEEREAQSAMPEARW